MLPPRRSQTHINIVNSISYALCHHRLPGIGGLVTVVERSAMPAVWRGGKLVIALFFLFFSANNAS